MSQSSAAKMSAYEYGPGHGDYTTERATIFADVTLEEALRRIKRLRPKGEP